MKTDQIRQMALNERIARHMVTGNAFSADPRRYSRNSLNFHRTCTPATCPPGNRIHQGRDRVWYLPVLMERAGVPAVR